MKTLQAVSLLGLIACRPVLPPIAEPTAQTIRTEFIAAMASVRPGMSTQEVRTLLGKPDEVFSNAYELHGLHGDALWCYGVSEPGGYPTLGEVCILGGKIYWKSVDPYPWPKHLDLNAPAIKRAFRLLGGEGRNYHNDTLWMVRAANAVIDLGSQNAWPAIEAFHRRSPATDLEPILRLVCKMPDPPGFRKPPKSDFMVPELRPSFTRGPRFPMIVLDDIPFVFSLGAIFTTGPQGSDNFVDYRTFPIRTTRLHPPDDPFVSCERLVASDQWPFPEHAKAEDRFRQPYKENVGEAMRQVLSLLFDVYQPMDYRSDNYFNGVDLEKFHQGFLKLGVHWDERLQRYVRADGVSLREKLDPPVAKWRPADFNHVHAVVSLQRAGVSDEVSAEVEANGVGNGPTIPEALKVFDAKTGKLIEWVGFAAKADDDDHRGSVSTFLAGRGYSDGLWSHSGGQGITLPRGAAVRVELVTRRRTVRGPVLRP